MTSASSFLSASVGLRGYRGINSTVETACVSFLPRGIFQAPPSGGPYTASFLPWACFFVKQGGEGGIRGQGKGYKGPIVFSAVYV